jgi:hypothetical protein
VPERSGEVPERTRDLVLRCLLFRALAAVDDRTGEFLLGLGSMLAGITRAPLLLPDGVGSLAHLLLVLLVHLPDPLSFQVSVTTVDPAHDGIAAENEVTSRAKGCGTRGEQRGHDQSRVKRRSGCKPSADRARIGRRTRS